MNLHEVTLKAEKTFGPATHTPFGPYHLLQSALNYSLCTYASQVQSERDRIHIELDRITTRTTSLNLTRLENCADAIHSCAQEIVDLTHTPTKKLPTLAPHALSAQLIVVVRDYLSRSADKSQSQSDSTVADLLEKLRRDLP